MLHDCSITESPSRAPRSARDVRSRCRDERYGHVAVLVEPGLRRTGRPAPARRRPVATPRGGARSTSAYVYHPMNSYDLPDGRVVCDVVRHPKMFDTDRNGPNEGPTEPRAVDDRSRRRARARRGPRRPGPGVPTARRAARRAPQPLRVRRRVRPRAWNTGRRSSTTSTRARPKCTSTARVASRLEPVFVPRTDDAAEDDGWVMSYVLRRDHGRERHRDPRTPRTSRVNRSPSSRCRSACRSASTATGCPTRREALTRS